MPSPAPEPLTSRPLSIWLVNPFDDIPGEGIPPLRYWSLARVLAARGHEVTWWTATWSHRRKAIRTAPLGIREDEGFAVRLVAVRPYAKNVSLARIGSHKDFGRTFERLASEGVSSGQLARPDIILASLPPLESPEAGLRLASKLDATFILDVQDLWPETFERLVPGPGFLKQLLAPLLLGNMAARRQTLVAGADALSATTNAYAAAAFADAPADTPRHVCYVGAYVDEFPGPPRNVSDVPRVRAGDGHGRGRGFRRPSGCRGPAGGPSTIRGLFSAAGGGSPRTAGMRLRRQPRGGPGYRDSSRHRPGPLGQGRGRDDPCGRLGQARGSPAAGRRCRYGLLPDDRARAAGPAGVCAAAVAV